MSSETAPISQSDIYQATNDDQDTGMPIVAVVFVVFMLVVLAACGLGWFLFNSLQ